MPSVTTLEPQEAKQLLDLGMGEKDYGVMRRAEDMLGLLCYATRDYIWIKIGPPLSGEEVSRSPDDAEKQIMRENGIPAGLYDVTFRAADVIQLRFCDTATFVEIWRGDRKW